MIARTAEVWQLVSGGCRTGKGSRTYLLVHNSTKTSLALDNGIGDAHLTAQRRKENNQLNGVDVVGNQNERSLLVLDEADDVVETVLDIVRLLAGVLLLLALSNSGSLAVETLLLLDLGLRAVLVEELEGLRSGVAVQSVLELGDRRRHLEAHVQNLLLALQAHILRPLDEAGQVALGLDVLADAEVAGTSLGQGVLMLLASCCLRGNVSAAYLGSLLAGTSLTLGVGHGRGLLSRLGRLSLRKEDQQIVSTICCIFLEL